MVAEPQSRAGRPGGGLVEVAGERGDRGAVREARRRHRRHDHRVRADPPGPVEQRPGVLAEGPRVHGAHGQPRLVEVRAQRVRAFSDVVRLDGAVAEAPDGRQHRLTAVGKLVSYRVQLQGRRVARQFVAAFHALR